MPTIGTAARQTGCNVETISYYERIGMLPQPPRGHGGRRSYGDAEIRQLRFIRRCRDLGFTLKEIQALSALTVQGKQDCRQVKQIAETHSDLVRRKMSDLARIEAWLSDMIGRCGSTARKDCPLIENLFQSPPP